MKPLFITKEGKFYCLLNVITSECGDQSYICTKNSLGQDKLDSGIHHQAEWMNMTGLYNKESRNIIDEIDLVSDFEEIRCFGVDCMDGSDHDKN